MRNFEQEVQFALTKGFLQFNAANTIDAVWPYVFSDGSTWPTISGFSTITAPVKTSTNIFWGGIFFNGSKLYAPTNAPVAADLTPVWSVSNITEPVIPANGIQIGQSIAGVGDGTNADIRDFTFDGLGIHLNAQLDSAVLTSTTAVNLNSTLINWVPPNAKSINMLVRVTGATGVQVTIQMFLGPDSTLADVRRMSVNYGNAETSPQTQFRMSMNVEIKTAQTIFYKVDLINLSGLLSLRSYR